jgi:hypothetical protein
MDRRSDTGRALNVAGFGPPFVPEFKNRAKRHPLRRGSRNGLVDFQPLNELAVGVRIGIMIERRRPDLVFIAAFIGINRPTERRHIVRRTLKQFVTSANILPRRTASL